MNMEKMLFLLYRNTKIPKLSPTCRKQIWCLIRNGFQTTSVHSQQIALSASLRSINNSRLFIHTCCQNYAKSKDRVKSKGKKHVVVNEEELSRFFDVGKMHDTFKKHQEDFQSIIIAQYSLRNSAGTFHELQVIHEGTKYALQDLADINRKNPKVVTLSFDSFPQVIPNVLQSLISSGLGLNPQQDGLKVHVPIPKVTKEHRELMSKNLKATFVKFKLRIKNTQEEYCRCIKDFTGASEDDVYSARLQVVAIADNYLADVELIFKKKEEALLSTD